MVGVSDDVWFFGSMIMASTSDVWWISLCWLCIASWFAASKLVSLWRDK